MVAVNQRAVGWQATLLRLNRLDMLLDLVEVERLASDALVNFHNVEARCLKVRCGIVRRANKHLVLGAVVNRFVHVVHLDEFFVNDAQKIEAGLDLILWHARLNIGADKSNVLALGSNAVSVRHERNVYVVLPVDLVLGNDDLARERVVRVGYRMRENADAPDDLANLLDAVREVRRVANNDLRLRKLALRLDADSDAIVKHNLLHRLVEHVGATVNGAQARKPLGKLSEAIKRVNVGRVAVASERFAVQLDAINCLYAGHVEVVIVLVQSNSMTRKVGSVAIQAKLVKDFLHLRPCHVLGFLGSKSCAHMRNERKRRFSKIPMRLDDSASFSVTGTLCSLPALNT
eukprot:Opistho-2@89266